MVVLVLLSCTVLLLMLCLLSFCYTGWVCVVGGLGAVCSVRKVARMRGTVEEMSRKWCVGWGGEL